MTVWRTLRIWIARRRLERLIARRKAEMDRREYAKHRAAGKLGWSRRKGAEA